VSIERYGLEKSFDYPSLQHVYQPSTVKSVKVNGSLTSATISWDPLTESESYFSSFPPFSPFKDFPAPSSMYRIEPVVDQNFQIDVPLALGSMYGSKPFYHMSDEPENGKKKEKEKEKEKKDKGREREKEKEKGKPTKHQVGTRRIIKELESTNLEVFQKIRVKMRANKMAFPISIQYQILPPQNNQ